MPRASPKKKKSKRAKRPSQKNKGPCTKRRSARRCGSNPNCTWRRNSKTCVRQKGVRAGDVIFEGPMRKPDHM